MQKLLVIENNELTFKKLLLFCSKVGRELVIEAFKRWFFFQTMRILKLKIFKYFFSSELLEQREYPRQKMILGRRLPTSFYDRESIQVNVWKRKDYFDRGKGRWNFEEVEEVRVRDEIGKRISLDGECESFRSW